MSGSVNLNGADSVPWTADEDDRLASLARGRARVEWTSLVHLFPGRTKASIRNRWARISKGEQLRALDDGTLSNRCGACGELKRGHICHGAKTAPYNRKRRRAASATPPSPLSADFLAAYNPPKQTRPLGEFLICSAVAQAKKEEEERRRRRTEKRA